MLLFPVRCNRRGDGDASFTRWGGCNPPGGGDAVPCQLCPDRPSRSRHGDADCDDCLVVEDRGDMDDLKCKSRGR